MQSAYCCLIVLWMVFKVKTCRTLLFKELGTGNGEIHDIPRNIDRNTAHVRFVVNKSNDVRNITSSLKEVQDIFIDSFFLLACYNQEISGAVP